MFKLDIQLFADDGADTTQGGDNTTQGGEDTPTITNDMLNEYLDSEDGKKFLQPKLDKYFSKGLDSWKENNLEKIYQERYAQENPGETKEMKMIRELQAKIAKQEKDALVATMNGVAINELSEKNLPVEFAAYLRGDTEQQTKMNVMEFENLFNKHVQAVVEGKITPTKTKATPDNKGAKNKYQNDPFMATFTEYDKYHE